MVLASGRRGGGGDGQADYCTPQMLLPSGAAKAAAGWSSRGPKALSPACDAQLFICSAGKSEIGILYRSPLWAAASTEKTTSVTSRAGKEGKERMMATDEKKTEQSGRGECLNGSWVEHKEHFFALLRPHLESHLDHLALAPPA